MTTDAPRVPESAQIPFDSIDEHAPGNPLSDIRRLYHLPIVNKGRDRDMAIFSGFSHFSSEGFAGNVEGQATIAQFLAEKLKLKERGSVLDVGFGSNIHVTNTFAHLGIESHALDLYTPNPESGRDASMFDVPPHEFQLNENGVRIHVGDVTKLKDERSGLKDTKFGCVLFSGSWASGQNNFAVTGEMLEFKDHDVQQGRIMRTPTNGSFYENEKDAMTQACVDGLAPNGLVGVVSSRYAFHGGGYGFTQLPYEKLHFMDLYDRLRRQGAKKFYVFGVSTEGIATQINASIAHQEQAGDEVKIDSDDSISVRDVYNALTDTAALPQEPEYFQARDKREESIVREHFTEMLKRTEKVDVFKRFSRIDALFAEF